MIQWQILDDAQTVAQTACARIVQAAQQAIEQRGQFKVVLAGGQTPEQVYQLLATAETPWQHWQIFYGDERCLPTTHPQRNSVMAAQAWLDKVSIPAEHIHPIPAQLGPIEAAQRYQETIAPQLPFDMVLLGIGEDGHTASLFPDQLHPTDELVHAVFNAPKPPPERVSLSIQALSQTQALLVLVTGASKHSAVTQWQQGQALPISQLHPTVAIEVLLDHSAALGN